MSYTRGAHERAHRTGAYRPRHAFTTSPRHRRATAALATLTRVERIAAMWVPLLAGAIIALCEAQVHGWAM